MSDWQVDPRMIDDYITTGDEQDDEEEEYHPYDCTCEDCLQNHPERDILYGDGDYFNWDGAAQHSVHWTLRLWTWLKNFVGLGLRQ